MMHCLDPPWMSRFSFDSLGVNRKQHKRKINNMAGNKHDRVQPKTVRASDLCKLAWQPHYHLNQISPNWGPLPTRVWLEGQSGFHIVAYGSARHQFASCVQISSVTQGRLTVTWCFDRVATRSKRLNLVGHSNNISERSSSNLQNWCPWVQLCQLVT